MAIFNSKLLVYQRIYKLFLWFQPVRSDDIPIIPHRR